MMGNLAKLTFLEKINIDGTKSETITLIVGGECSYIGILRD